MSRPLVNQSGWAKRSTDQITPNTLGVLKDGAAFFRFGTIRCRA